MIAIISDVHGNYPALKAVLEKIDKIGCKTIVSLGDVAGYYCMINECIEELKNRNVINIMGNHDNYILTGSRCPRSYSANLCLDYQNKILDYDNRQWLLKSYPNLILKDINMVHGGWKNNSDEYLYKIEKEYFQNINGNVFFSGHTHIQILKNMGNKIYCNPGSVGQPRDGDWRASFAIIKENSKNIILERVEYDIERIVFEMKKAQFESHLYNNLYYGVKIGDKISRFKDN